MSTLARHDVLAIGRKGNGRQCLARHIDKVSLPVFAWVEQHNRASAAAKDKREKRALIYNSKPTKGGVLAVIGVIPVHPSLESIQLRVCTRQGF